MRIRLQSVLAKAKHTSTIAVCPTQEMCNGWAIRKTRIQHPVDDKGCILVGRVFRTDYQTPEQVCSVFVRSYNNGILEEDMSIFYHTLDRK